jgi:excinuclease ABC subunit C
MKKSAAEKQFEQAARLRDQLRALSVLHERQAVIFPARVSWDFIGIVTEASIACVNLFKIREGKLIDKEQFIYEGMVTETLVLQTFLENYYADSSDLPKEIYVPEMPQDSSVVMRLLRVRSNRSITMTVPTRGKKLGLLRLATTNAKEALYTFRRSLASDRDIVAQALAKLQSILGLEELPHRIEGYDISNTQGTNPVGSMVVFSQGLPAKAEYRKFKITGKQTPDDFSMMREMLSRRLQRLAPTQGAWPTPNLLVIDGGKGQLSVATAVLKEKKLRIPVIGLAKRIEEIFVPGKKQPILLAHSDPALQLLQRLRDEAHRFAITFHRSIRSKQAVISALDKVPGVGAKTKKLLKQKFGTVAQIRQTDEATLASVVGTDKAKKLKKYL